MYREHLHAESARGFNGSRDGVGDVVEFQIEPHLCAGGQNRVHEFGAFRRVKLELDFEKRDLVPELLNELEGPLLCGDVQRHNDFVSGLYHVERSRDMSVFRPRARDSSTSLRMTEQIARYANPRTREDQSFTESSWPSQRWLSRNRDFHRADFAL